MTIAPGMSVDMDSESLSRTRAPATCTHACVRACMQSSVGWLVGMLVGLRLAPWLELGRPEAGGWAPLRVHAMAVPWLEVELMVELGPSTLHMPPHMAPKT